MRDFPKKVYLSTSWKDADFAISSLVVQPLLDAGVTVVGDHKDYQNDDPFDRPWTDRILQNIADCSAVIAVLPKKGCKQTTSFYMFPEILAAAYHKIPLLLFCHQGVDIRKVSAVAGYDLLFGSDTSMSLSPNALFKSAIKKENINKALEAVGCLELRALPHLEGPFAVPETEFVPQIVSKFVETHVKRVEGAFVFNILPFALRESVHVDIARAVYEETGLPCRIALDVIGESQSIRRQWRDHLQNAEFIIAELSELRGTCLFEAGVGLGMDKKVFIVASGRIPKLPYGLDDTPAFVYTTPDSLRKVVRERCCGEYKRQVYNLDSRILKSRTDPAKLMGVPDWYTDESVPRSGVYVEVACWCISFAIGFMIWAIFLWIGYGTNPIAVASPAIATFSLLASHATFLREWLKKKSHGRVQQLVIASLAFLFISSAASTAIFFLRGEPAPAKQLIGEQK